MKNSIILALITALSLCSCKSPGNNSNSKSVEDADSNLYFQYPSLEYILSGQNWQQSGEYVARIDHHKLVDGLTSKAHSDVLIFRGFTDQLRVQLSSSMFALVKIDLSKFTDVTEKPEFSGYIPRTSADDAKSFRIYLLERKRCNVKIEEKLLQPNSTQMAIFTVFGCVS